MNHILAIIIKNLLIYSRNKKKLLGLASMPFIIAIALIVINSYFKQNQIIRQILMFLLQLYLAMINISFSKEIITYFISETTQQFKQYQCIMGLSKVNHLLGNLIFMNFLMFLSLTPLLITFCYYQPSHIWIYTYDFAVFTCTSNCFCLIFITSFKDHRIASQVASIAFSLVSFFPLNYNENSKSWLNIICEIFPNSAFSLSVLAAKWQYKSLVVIPVSLAIYSLLQFTPYIKSIFCNKKQQQTKNLPDTEQQNTLVDEINHEELGFSDMKNKKNIIQINNLTKLYGQSLYALDNLNLQIKSKQIFGLLGRNGAGKTTLVDLITQVSQPTTGTIDILSNSTRKLGICYQKQILYENLTVTEHLQFYSRIRSTNQEQISNILEKLNITNEKDQFFQKLSGGNKRKLSIGIAILGQPDLLIFDEPTSGLDPHSRRYIWSVLQHLKSESRSIILTSHHLDEIQYLSDRICILQKGKIIFDGSAFEIKQKYGHGYYLTINSKHKKQRVDDLLAEHLKQIKYKQLASDKNSLNYFISSCPEKIIVELIQKLQMEDLNISLENNDLEQSFVAILQAQNQKSSGEIQLNSLINRFSQIDEKKQSSLCWQIYAMFLRSFYVFKGELIKKLILYNLNIILVLLNYVISTIAKKALQQKSQPDQNASQISSQLSLLQGYLIMCSVYVSLPVYEKQNKIIPLFLTQNISKLSYWFGTFLFDFLMFILNLGLLFLLNFYGYFGELPHNEIIKMGIAAIIFSYTCSYLFSKQKTADNYFGLITMVFGYFIIPLSISETGTFLDKLVLLKYIYPFYQMGSKILGSNKNLNTVVKLFGSSHKSQGTSLQSYIQPVYFTIIFYLVLMVIIETKVIYKVMNYFKKNNVEIIPIHKDIQLDSVSKKYSRNGPLVVNNVSFDVQSQNMALLGHNGAGKSTTFEMLSFQLQPTQGQLFVEGKLKTSSQNSLKSTSICYQTNTLWNSLTVRQILHFFSIVFNVSDSYEKIEKLCSRLQFQGLQKRYQNLSGGNKRKICVAVALLAEPDIQLLDQCSTGLDPSSRNSMVQSIKNTKKKSIVFTTHSMIQAQNLCSKVLILQKGQIQQYGFIYQLRKKYFNCYWISIITKNDCDIQQLYKSIFSKSESMITKIQQKQFKVEINKNNMKLSELLRRLQHIKQMPFIQRIHLSQPKLQDIYLKLSEDNQIQIQ